MKIEDINQAYLNKLSLPQKAKLKADLEINLRMKQIIFDDELRKSTEDKER